MVLAVHDVRRMRRQDSTDDFALAHWRILTLSSAGFQPAGKDAGGTAARMAALQLHAHILRLGEEVERFEAALATEAAVAHAAERHAQVAAQPAVDPHRSAVDRRSDAVRALEVGRPDARGQHIP